jgi:flagellar protein FlaG
MDIHFGNASSDGMRHVSPDVATKGRPAPVRIPVTVRRGVKVPEQVAGPSARDNLAKIAERLRKEDLREFAEEINRVVERNFDKRISFDVFEKTDELYVKILNRDTREVLKTIPPEEFLELAYRINEAIGMLFDQAS